MEVFGIATYTDKNNINIGSIKNAKFSDYESILEVKNVKFSDYDNNTCYVEGTLDNIKDNTGDVTIFAYK